MKIAFILLCHKNSSQINMLISELQKCNSDIYIHVDLKNEKLRSELNIGKNVFLIPEEMSYSIEWGGLDMVRATLSLMQFVCESGQNYNHVCLLSGQDFPIRPIKEFELFLNNHLSSNFIEIISQTDKRYFLYNKRCEIPYPKWINNNSFFIKVIKRLYMIITGGYSHTFNFFIRKKPFDLHFSFGSQWWCLTFDCVKYILSYTSDHPEYINYFEQCIVPDECFFQTIFENCPFSSNHENYLTYVNWGKNRRSPEILKMDDYERIVSIKKDFYFARKFDSEIDLNVIKRFSTYGENI